ncbi:hypothetical protein [Floridanema evergladense]|uniref:Uncharacterized protein n=1 Tax=Floridaenema evergladense BLCC-F167 TaxID=3153639 RepID=A0ABV4WWX9_9CYAN
MTQLFLLCPRYRLDDESPWLLGIDPARHYWISINGDAAFTESIPGLTVSSVTEWKQIMRQFRGLQPGEQIKLARISQSVSIICISENCFAIATESKNAPVWHLFDQETLESLLRTAHPDWQCSEKDIDLGRQMLFRSLQQSEVSVA